MSFRGFQKASGAVHMAVATLRGVRAGEGACLKHPGNKKKLFYSFYK